MANYARICAQKSRTLASRKLSVASGHRLQSTSTTITGTDSRLQQLTAKQAEIVAFWLYQKQWEVNASNIDYIVTKMVINGWPQDYYTQENCLTFDNFCYHYAIGFCKNTGQECGASKRYHKEKFSIEKMYNNGKCSVNNKRKAYYLCYYLSHYCGYNRSRDLQKYLMLLEQDKDFKMLEIHYDVKSMFSELIAYNDAIQKSKDERPRRKQNKQNKKNRKAETNSTSQGSELMSSASTES